MPSQIGRAEQIPVGPATSVVSVSPVTLSAPDRAIDLEMRVSAPVSGSKLPVILLSHGHGQSNNLSSLNGYGPLANFYAAHGFVVIQPTHLSSKSLGLDPTGLEGPLFWRSRAEDMRAILDRLAEIEAAVPQIAGRLDSGRVAAVGHSLGGHTVALLAGMQVTDPSDGQGVNAIDERIRATVMFGAPGSGTDLAPFAAEHFPILKSTSFAEMTQPALVVCGDKDVNPMFSTRENWRADAYTLSPGPKSLLTVFGAEHIFGGISGYDAAETSDESPERVAFVQRLSWAYLRTSLYPDDPAWEAARASVEDASEPLGRVYSK